MYRVSALQQPYELLAQQRGSALAAMHQQNLAGRDGFCIECEKALLRQKDLCEQRWQNADSQPLLHKRDNGGGGTHGVVGQKRDPLFGKPCVQIAPGTGAGLHRHDGEPEYLIVRQMPSGQRFESGPGHKHVTKRGKLSHGQVPILTFTEDERILLEKLPRTGGRLDRQTVTEQLLYEIQDPANYFTPDVIADFSRLSVEELSDGRVEVKGAAGKKRTGTLKVSVGYQDGYIGEGQISYGGRNCVARAKLAAEVIQKRLVLLNKHYSETRTDLIGVNSLYGAEQEKVFPALQLSEVRLRVAVRAEKEEDAEVIGREIEALYVNGPAGGGGVRSSVESVLSIASVLIPEEDVHPAVCWERGE